MIELLNKSGLNWAQSLVARYHYLGTRVDVRCSPVGYAIKVHGQRAGCLIFGRPEATRCANWYGSVADVAAGKAEVTRWQVLNLARVYVLPEFQPGGCYHSAEYLPGFIDRRGVFRSTLASTAIAEALNSIIVDYLLMRPLCFPDEPYEIRWCLSYCDTSFHRGALYRAAGFDLYRTNKRGIQTWRKRLRELAADENKSVLEASRLSERSIRYRAARAQVEQLALSI